MLSGLSQSCSCETWGKQTSCCYLNELVLTINRLVKHQVIDIFCLDEVQVCQTKDEAQKYFTPNGIPWTVRDLKRFLEAYALSTSGQIQEGMSLVLDQELSWL
jgi:hypothetical protein